MIGDDVFCLLCLDWQWTSLWQLEVVMVLPHSVFHHGRKFWTHLLRHWRSFLRMCIAVLTILLYSIWVFCILSLYIVFAFCAALCVTTKNEWMTCRQRPSKRRRRRTLEFACLPSVWRTWSTATSWRASPADRWRSTTTNGRRLSWRRRSPASCCGLSVTHGAPRPRARATSPVGVVDLVSCLPPIFPCLFYPALLWQTPSKTQMDKETNGQTPGIVFGAFKPKMWHLVAIILMIFLIISWPNFEMCIYWLIQDFTPPPLNFYEASRFVHP